MEKKFYVIKELDVEDVMGEINYLQTCTPYKNTDAFTLLNMLITEINDDLFSTELYDDCYEWIENNAVFVDGILKVV